MEKAFKKQKPEDSKINTNPTLSKAKIGLNQFRAEIRENKNLKKKEKLDALRAQKEAGEKKAKRIQKEYDEGKIGAGALREKRAIEKLGRKLDRKSDKLQSNIENRENRIKLLINKRDAVAEKMILRYEKELNPVEARLEKMKERRDKIELVCLGNEVKIEDQKKKIDHLAKEKEDLIEKLEESNLYGKEARKHPSVLLLEKQIEDGYSNLAIMKEENVLQRKEINSLIAKLDKKAQPHRDKRDRFVRIKENRPLDVKLEDRPFLEEPSHYEKTKAHFRVKSEEPKTRTPHHHSSPSVRPSPVRATNRERAHFPTTRPTQERVAYPARRMEPLQELAQERERPLIEEKGENLFMEKENTFSDWVEKYNDFITTSPEYSKDEKNALLLDKEELIGGTRLNEGVNLKRDNFEEIIKSYYQAKEVPENYYEEILDNLKEDTEGGIENVFTDKENAFSGWIEKYNDFIATNPEYSENEKSSLLLNSDELIKATRLNGDIGVSRNNFRKIIETYYQMKKVSGEHYKNIISNFEEPYDNE